MASKRSTGAALMACLGLGLLTSGAFAARGYGIGPQESPSCPPAGFETLADFDFDEFISAPWYVQMQEPLIYQFESDLNCVRATYIPIDDKDLSKGVKSYQYANEDKVNGEPTGDIQIFGIEIDAVLKPEQPNNSSKYAASKNQQGPSIPILGDKVLSSYWVVDAGTLSSESGYDWAIVMGGEPKFEAEKGQGCRANTGKIIGGREMSRYAYKGGLWLFSRKPVDAEAAAAMTRIAKDKGIDVSQLIAVKQEGCKYKGAMNVDGTIVE